MKKAILLTLMLTLVGCSDNLTTNNHNYEMTEFEKVDRCEVYRVKKCELYRDYIDLDTEYHKKKDSTKVETPNGSGNGYMITYTLDSIVNITYLNKLKSIADAHDSVAKYTKYCDDILVADNRLGGCNIYKSTIRWYQ